MGAEFMLTYVKKLGKTSMAKRERPMLEHLEKMRIKPSRWKEFYDWRCDGIPDSPEIIRADAEKAIKDFFACQDGSDVAYIDVPGILLVISGGLSFGGSPTENFDVIGRFALMPRALLDAGGFR
jgi:hypothetical protein